MLGKFFIDEPLGLDQFVRAPLDESTWDARVATSKGTPADKNFLRRDSDWLL
jgi:hypothetical protein